MCTHTIKGWKVTRSSPDDPGIAQYRAFYAKQLPGMPYYDDSYHVTLTLDGTARQVVSAAATFDFVDLTTNDGTRVLILDVLALAVNPAPLSAAVSALRWSTRSRPSVDRRPTC